MSKATHFARLLRHFNLCATEPCCAIVLSETEFEILGIALGMFRDSKVLTDKGVDIVDALRTHLRDYYEQLRFDKLKVMK